MPALTVQVLLIQADLGAMRNWPLAPRDSRADRLVEIDDASSTLQGVAPEAVRLVAALVERSSCKLAFALVGIF